MKFRYILLILFITNLTFRLFGADFPVAGESAGFMNLTEISSQEWNSMVPESVRKNQFPARFGSNDFHTSQFLYKQLSNNSDSSFYYIEFSNQLELVELFFYSPSMKEWVHTSAGDQVPMAQRDLPNNNLLLPLEIKSGESLKLYFKVQDYQFKNVQVRIISPGDFLRGSGKGVVIDITMFALIFFMVAYMFVHYYTSRQLYYIFYALVMACLSVAMLGKYRYLSYLFMPNIPYGYFVYIFFNSSAVLSALFFFRSFFGIKTGSPLFIISAVFSAGLAVTAVLAFFIPIPRLGDVMNVIIVPSLLVILIKSIKSGISGDNASRMIIISFLPVLAGAIGDNMGVYLHIPEILAKNRMMLFGTAVHIFLMNYGLAIRQAEREREYRSLKYQFSSKVEKSVAERTRELEFDASFDPLTGVLNRASMDKKLKEIEKSSDSAFGILFADLDNFKYYNDHFGHPLGDKILKETAAFLKRQIRNNDLVFRYGGDEFLILMPETLPEQAAPLGERLHMEFQKFAELVNADLDCTDVYLGLTLGFAEWQPGESLTDAVNLADQAMMEAKRQGKNRIWYYRKNAADGISENS